MNLHFYTFLGELFVRFIVSFICKFGPFCFVFWCSVFRKNICFSFVVLNKVSLPIWRQKLKSLILSGSLDCNMTVIQMQPLFM